jgi:hypothetical protein
MDADSITTSIGEDAMTNPDQPSWYDDTSDPNAQRYWDGQEWTPHRQRKQTPAVRQPAPPPPQPLADGTLSGDQLGPYADGAGMGAATSKQFVPGLSRERQIILIVVGLVTTAVIVAFGAHLFRSGGPETVSAPGAGKSTYASADKSSRSYRVGLEAGKNGQAETAAYGGFDILRHQNTAPMSYDDACKGQFNLENGADPDLVERDYMAGCLDGLNDQSAQWTQGRKAKGGN